MGMESTQQQSKKCGHLVVDAGGFLKDAKLADLGERIVTLRDVVAEIRDKATRDRLQVLPYELQFMEPMTEDIAMSKGFKGLQGLN